MINTNSVFLMAGKIEKEMKKKKYSSAGYVRGGEIVVFIKNYELLFASDLVEKIEYEGGKIVCMIAYYDNPDFNKECTADNIYNKIKNSLIEKGVWQDYGN